MDYADLIDTETDRLVFEEQFEISLSIARREGWHGALMAFELTPRLERERPLSEDDLLALAQEIGTRIRKVIRSEDVFLRLGPRRYLVWLQRAVADQVEGIAGRLAQELEHPITTPNTTMTHHVHIGMSLYPFDGGSLERLQHYSEVALEQARELEKTVQIYNPEGDGPDAERW